MKEQTVKTKIVTMKASGLSARDIAEKLNTAGTTTATGLKWTSQKIFDVVYQSKNKSDNKRSYVKKARQLLGTEAEETTTGTNTDILGLLDSQRYTDRQKVEAVKALLR